MPNPHRGEIEACLDGKPFRLCLTLGALAELESAFGNADMLALAERFQAGRLSARDAQLIIGAAGFVDIVARLLTATFGVRPDTPGAPRDLGRRSGSDPITPASPEVRSAPAPFPGAT